ncbi:DUF1642 domain-containing protein [Streptococcus suis]|uniref:DUF1642 domain-containing protein n=1 Tax=Streptococcus suis TaxID=1307 RepID=UPI0038BA7CB3
MNKQEAIEIIEQSTIKIPKRVKVISKADNVLVETGFIDYVPLDVVVNTIDKIHEPQKVVVPKFVAEWIKETKEHHPNLRWVWTVYPNDLELNKWLDTNTETFMLAWLFGYEVEQEPLYTVEIPNPNNTSANVLCLRKDGGKIHISKQNHKTYKQSRYCHLTESEIKEDFEWAWRFAKEVE